LGKVAVSWSKIEPASLVVVLGHETDELQLDLPAAENPAKTNCGRQQS